MAQKSSIALFLATAGLISFSGSAVSAAQPNSWSASQSSHAQLLADAAECVPIGEGENCERETIETRKAKKAVGKPAAVDSAPTSNPAVSDGSSKDQLMNQVERSKP